MYLKEIWRYPVKSMAGEPLSQAELTSNGIVGDRVVHVQDGLGRIVSARTRPALLGHRARLGSNGEPLVDGRPWHAPEVAAAVRAAAGETTCLIRSDGIERFDVLPLLVATDGALAVFGYDGRRLRPNLVIGGVPGLSERQWEGRFLRVGEAILGIRSLRKRCIMTTFDPDTLEQDVEVLRSIHQRFGGSLALNCWVERGGVLHIGDPVELLDDSELCC
jgi:hypothetical protein